MMDGDRAVKVARSAWRQLRGVREALRRSPGLELLAAVGAGFAAGLLLRALDRRDDRPRRCGAEEE